MILRARTFPTPGSDSSTDETFIFPTMSSPCLARTSRSVIFSDFRWPLSSARALRASAALASACLRCSSVRVGSGMLPPSSSGPSGRDAGGIISTPPRRQQSDAPVTSAFRRVVNLNVKVSAQSLPGSSGPCASWTSSPSTRFGRSSSTCNVARGRSAHWSQLHGPVQGPRLAFTERRFVVPERYKQWPQAHLHTQWPGEGKAGDASFDQFYASQVPAIQDFTLQQTLNRDALVPLLDTIGPAVLLTHSQSGAFGWPVADRRPNLLKAIVAVEPNGPPFFDVENVPAPEWFRDAATPARPWGITAAPLAYSPAARNAPTPAEKTTSRGGKFPNFSTAGSIIPT